MRLWRGAAVMAGLSLALSAGGCSLSSQFDSYFGGDKSEATGSITPPPGTKQTANVPDGDLAYARAAASEVLTRNEKDASQPWANPKSGARGTVTPVASAYSGEGGQTCRNFLASYVNGRAEAWLQGEACKHAKGVWEVRSLKPWNRS